MTVNNLETLNIMKEVEAWYSSTDKFNSYTDKLVVAEFLANKIGKTFFTEQ